jgi:polyisoprenoid-binding protein YceI
MTPTTSLPTGTWQIDPSSTTVTVSAKMFSLLTVPATFTVVSGTIEVDAENEVTAVDVVVDASSYASKNAKRNEHVVGPDFLDATTHSTISFQASRVTQADANYTTSGTITSKGKPSPMEVAVSDVEIDGGSGSFTASATVDRTTLGVDKMPGLVIGRNVELTVDARVTAAV